MRILGISPFHDSSVCIIKDGKVELFLKEERLTRLKRDMYPWKSINKVLEKYKDKIDRVVVASPFNSEYNEFLFQYLIKSFNTEVMDMSGNHHIQHASLAFYNSGFEEALVFVVDRNGSFYEDVGYEAESVFLASYPNEFKPLYKTFAKDEQLGIVKVYESATTLIGQHPLENGKTMGLAAYGSDKDSLVLFDQEGMPKDRLFDRVKVNNFGHNNAVVLKNKKHLITSIVSENNYKDYAEYAHLVQAQTQNQMVKLIEEFVEKTKIKKVCITGGYGLNVVANNFYLENFPDVEFFFEPLADDSGNSIGAAMFIYRELTKDTKINKIKNTFFHGENYPVDFNFNNTSYENIANLLIEGKTIGVYGGLAEAGPRALGNRSILFDPRIVNGKEIVNKIKNREWYRPFGAVMLEEDFLKNFYTNNQTKNEFMTVSFKIKEGFEKIIPAVSHIDNTCRIQTVSSGHIYELLKVFKEKTGIGILLNTSLNRAGEPLLDTPKQALDMVENTNLDHIWFYEKNILSP